MPGRCRFLLRERRRPLSLFTVIALELFPLVRRTSGMNRGWSRAATTPLHDARTPLFPSTVVPFTPLMFPRRIGQSPMVSPLPSCSDHQGFRPTATGVQFTACLSDQCHESRHLHLVTYPDWSFHPFCLTIGGYRTCPALRWRVFRHVLAPRVFRRQKGAIFISRIPLPPSAELATTFRPLPSTSIVVLWYLGASGRLLRPLIVESPPCLGKTCWNLFTSSSCLFLLIVLDF